MRCGRGRIHDHQSMTGTQRAVAAIALVVGSAAVGAVGCGKTRPRGAVQEAQASAPAVKQTEVARATPVSPGGAAVAGADALKAMTDSTIPFLTDERVQHYIEVQTDAAGNPYDTERKPDGMIGREGDMNALEAFARAHGFSGHNAYEVTRMRIGAGLVALHTNGRSSISPADLALVKKHQKEIEAAQATFRARQETH